MSASAKKRLLSLAGVVLFVILAITLIYASIKDNQRANEIIENSEYVRGRVSEVIDKNLVTSEYYKDGKNIHKYSLYETFKVEYELDGNEFTYTFSDMLVEENQSSHKYRDDTLDMVERRGGFNVDDYVSLYANDDGTQVYMVENINSRADTSSLVLAILGSIAIVFIVIYKNVFQRKE